MFNLCIYKKKSASRCIPHVVETLLCLMLRHSAPHVPPNFLGIAYWVMELNATFCLDTRAKKWKYLILHFLECKSDPLPVAFTITLCTAALRWPLNVLIVFQFHAVSRTLIYLFLSVYFSFGLFFSLVNTSFFIF